MIIPQEVKKIIESLNKARFEAYIVGGCVRDSLIGIEPKDWDVTTDAKPEKIQKIFPDSFYENKFLTVTVRTGSVKIPEVEITTYRKEAKYSDKRHPDQIEFANNLEEDLARRDFTVNAMAINLNSKIQIPNSKTNLKSKILNHKLTLIDLFGGQEDLRNKIIRTVGRPEERFNEDALRMLRAVRFASTLDFIIEQSTAKAMQKNSVWLEVISKERIRDELLKIIMSDRAGQGIELLRQLNLLKFIIPELQENYGVGQNKHHIYDCYTHALKSLEYAVKKKFGLHVRLASLFHDIGKPRVKVGQGPDSTFYNHEVVGAKMAFEILNRLKFPKKDVEKIAKLVRYHLFYYNVGEVFESSVRRLVKNVGPENMEELLQLRQCDRIGSGVPKAEPYKLRHLKYVIEKVSKDPISVKMLKVDGLVVMDILKIEPGPKIGQILEILLGQVLDDPLKNQEDILKKEIERLGALNDQKLRQSAEKSKEEKSKIESKEDEMVKKKYWVT